MANPFTLPFLGGTLLVAIAGGIQLGESTVGLIHPIHFQGPAVHPRDRGAAIDENPVRATEPSFASLYGWDQGRSAWIEDCGDCDALSARDSYVEYYDPPVTVHRAMAQGWDEPAYDDSDPTVGDDLENDVRDFDTELKERVIRYAYYEVEAPAEAESELLSDAE